jgi:hypothetical protein
VHGGRRKLKIAQNRSHHIPFQSRLVSSRLG